VCERLHPRGNVDAITQEVGTLHHNVAYVDADAESQNTVIGDGDVCGGEFVLYGGGAFDRIDNARELGKDAIPGRVCDPAAVPGDEAVHRPAVRRQGTHGPDLVDRHKP
jgi:hypothetical protein